MKNLAIAKEWLKRSKSNLARAKFGKVSDEILYEDLCFDACRKSHIMGGKDTGVKIS